MISHLKDADRHYNNGVLYFNKNQREKARESWDLALRADPRHFRTMVFKGLMSFEDGNLEEAILYYKRALDINADYHIACNNLGNAYRRRGDAEKAIRFYQRAVELEPRNASYHYNLGLTYFDVGDYENALIALRKAVVFDPEDAEAQLDLGETYYIMGERNKALEHFEIFLSLRPQAPNAFQVAAKVKMLGRGD